MYELRDEAAFEEESDVLPLYQPNEFRTSDHDPVIIGLNLNAPPTVDAGGPYSARLRAVRSPSPQPVPTRTATASPTPGTSITTVPSKPAGRAFPSLRRSSMVRAVPTLSRYARRIL